jgi:hypothetical protein
MMTYEDENLKQKTKRKVHREILIILIIALLLAFFIWRFFDYKIAKLKWTSGVSIEHTRNSNSSEI